MTDQDTQSVVYLVQIGKHIKIGVTRRLQRRLKSFLNSAVNVELLLTIPGDISLERRLHVLLSDSRIEREIFHRDSRVLSFIRDVKMIGLEHGIQYLEKTTPAAMARRKKVNREERTRLERLKKTEFDAYCILLVAERKRKIGW